MNSVAQSQQHAAIYCRVSSPGQEQDGTSLETQEAACRQYAAEHGYSLAERHVYRDIHSGADLHERPRLTALRAAVRRGELSVVISHAVDRLSRNQAHLYILAEELESSGVRLEFVTEDFEDSAVGKFIRSAKAFAAEVEREKFRERSRRGKLARVQAGKLMHGKAPLYGYDWPDSERGRYVVNPLTAPVVRRMFAEAVTGKPLRSIAAGLTADVIPAPRGGPIWDFVVISKILKNPAYAGDAYAFRTRYEPIPGTSRTRRVTRPREEWVSLPSGTIPPLVDATSFALVQERLRANRAGSPRRLRDPQAYLLRGGYVRCGYCGYVMVVHRKLRSVAYECVKRSRSSGLCTQHGISTRLLDAAVWARVEAVLTRPEVIALELQRLREDDPTAEDLTTVDRALADIKRKQGNLSRALTMFKDQDAARPVVQQMEALSGQQLKLEAEREAIRGRRAGWEAAMERLGDLQSWCETVAARLGELTYEQRRTALDALGIQARVWKADHEPRFVITASIPLDGLPSGQTGQASMLYVASQNASS